MQKTNCNPGLISFMGAIHPQDVFLSVLSIGEICYGVEKLPPGKKKHELSLWFYNELPRWFNGRIIPFETEVMIEWGRLRAGSPRTIPIADSLIASAAITHHMALVTRNIKDFKDIPGINLINPWELE
jgi:predicted nucleic acid-binding protein